MKSSSCVVPMIPSARRTEKAMPYRTNDDLPSRCRAICRPMRRISIARRSTMPLRHMPAIHARKRRLTGLPGRGQTLVCEDWKSLGESHQIVDRQYTKTSASFSANAAFPLQPARRGQRYRGSARGRMFLWRLSSRTNWVLVRIRSSMWSNAVRSVPPWNSVEAQITHAHWR